MPEEQAPSSFRTPIICTLCKLRYCIENVTLHIYQ